MKNAQENHQDRRIYALLSSQKGEQCLISDTAERCPLCGRMTELEQDHDHITDLCRGRICHSCNLMVGRFDRPLNEIRRFLDYLAHWSTEHAKGQTRTFTDYMREFAPRYRKRGHGRWKRAQQSET